MATQTTPPKKVSRLLAALDNSANLFGPTLTATAGASTLGQKRAFPLPGGPSGSGFKRRALAQDALMLVGDSRVIDDDEMSEDDDLNSAAASSSSPGNTPNNASHNPGGFGIRYDAESTIHKIDMPAPDQSLRMAEFVSRTIDNASQGLTVKTAMDYLGLKDSKDLLPGLEVRLLPHQMIGVSWMLKQELDGPHKGGILADDMGLGKTVQMIACMAMNTPESRDKHRATLLVVPAALLTQWKDELETKTNDMFSVHIHHGKDKLKDVDDIRSLDVVITSYQTLVMDASVPKDIDSEDEDEWLAENGGVLVRTKWYRVVTDESQFIRNRGTRASLSCARLHAKYRWCLTGTPITNSLADIYGLIRFGHFRPWNVWEQFNEYIAKTQLSDAPLAGLRSQEVLKPLLLRRTKNAELEGKPILQLPEKDVELVTVEFSADERMIYDHMEKQAQIQINRFIKNQTLIKNHSYVLVMILRLRQLCCHPYLILNLDDADNDPASVVADAAQKDVSRAVRTKGAQWVTDLKRKFLDRAKAGLKDFDEEDLEAPAGECPVCEEMLTDESGRVLACGHEACFDCLRELANSPIVHDGIFGFGNEQDNMRIEREFEQAAAKGLRPCPTCKKMCDMSKDGTFLSAAFKPSSEELQAATRRKYPGKSGSSSNAPRATPRSRPVVLDSESESESDSDDSLPDISSIIKSSEAARAKGKTPARASSVDDNDSEEDDAPTTSLRQQQNGHIGTPGQNGAPSQAIINAWSDGGSNLEPSAKMLQLIGFLQEWECTGDKVICFSQWTSMLDLVETLFTRYGIQSLRFDGSMRRESRESVLAQFRKPGGPHVILISTKCGGVGLNLTSANRVINLDLSWNYASESQAYDRVHRLGQEKEVYIKRLIVRDTIEERMLRLQETKTNLAEAALGEGSGVKLHRLSVKELKDLFGMSKKKDDHNNNQSRLPFQRTPSSD